MKKSITNWWEGKIQLHRQRNAEIFLSVFSDVLSGVFIKNHVGISNDSYQLGLPACHNYQQVLGLQLFRALKDKHKGSVIFPWEIYVKSPLLLLQMLWVWATLSQVPPYLRVTHHTMADVQPSAAHVDTGAVGWRLITPSLSPCEDCDLIGNI